MSTVGFRLISILATGGALLVGAVTIASGAAPGGSPAASSTRSTSVEVRGAELTGEGVPPDSVAAGALSPATSTSKRKSAGGTSKVATGEKRSTGGTSRVATGEKTSAAGTLEVATSTKKSTSTIKKSTGTIEAAESKNRSGLPWMSGAYVPADSPAALNAFGTWRKAPADVVLLYNGNDSWNDIDDPRWIFDSWKRAPQTVVLSAAPFPLTTGSLQACADGDYDAYWRTFGLNVKAAGMANRVIVRLAWEFNGSWNPWAAYNPATYKACYRAVYSAANHAAPALRWEWSVNRGVGDALPDATLAWPGIHYVDIVGMSSYDGYPAATNAAGWAGQYSGAGGLKFWADFARSKHKKLALAEWGLYPGTSWAGHGGGDDPYYISKMFGFFRQERSIMAYESYFNEDDPYQGGALQLNPKGGAQYKRQIAAARKLK